MSMRKVFVINSDQRQISLNDNCVDLDKFRDELLKLKTELNKRNKEYQDLKVEYIKLENDYKSNIKLMGVFLNESSTENNSPFYDTNNNNFIKETSPETNNFPKNKKRIKRSASSVYKQSFKKMKEKFIFLRMKEQINLLKSEIDEKNTIMNHLKSNSKIIKLRELDNKYAETYSELIELKNKYQKMEGVQKDYFNARNQIMALFQQLDSSKKQVKSQKEQIEKLTLLNKNNLNLLENQENHKNIEDNRLKFLKSENEKLKKQNKTLSLKYEIVAQENNRIKNIKPPTRKLAKVEIENKKLKKEIENYIKENERLKKLLKEKDEKIKSLEKPKVDDFFMTTTNIIKPKSNENEEKKEENKTEDNKAEDIKKEENKTEDIKKEDTVENKDNKKNEDENKSQFGDEKKIEEKDIELIDANNNLNNVNVEPNKEENKMENNQLDNIKNENGGNNKNDENNENKKEDEEKKI